MQEFEVETAVIGGGYIGTAVARETGEGTIDFEAENRFGEHQSGRNSGVIHSGITDPPGSLKSDLTPSGNREIYRFATDHGVRAKNTGKIIVASSEDELVQLRAVAEGGRSRKINVIEMSQDDVERQVPNLRSVGGLYIYSTGIIDSSDYLTALRMDAIRRGADFLIESPVIGGEITARGIVLQLGDRERSEVLAHNVVNAAGLKAQDVARSIKGFPPDQIPELHMRKGYYYDASGLSGDKPIYTLHSGEGLGIHLTFDLDGKAHFGPSSEMVEGVEYSFEDTAERRQMFVNAIARLFPTLDIRIHPGNVGIRPRVGDDFVIQGPSEHGIPGLVNLFNIGSPGLTDSLIIARRVKEKLNQV